VGTLAAPTDPFPALVGRSPITSIDLFAGAGGLTAGLHEGSHRIRTVRAVEFDLAAAATFDANHGSGLTYPGSIEDWLTEEETPEVDLVVGGPPCQGFSLLNRNRVGAERNSLWERYAETLVRARPKWFIMENVATFLKSPEYQELVRWTRPGGPLEDYSVEGRVLNAADYGAPQRRRRTVVLGHRRDANAVPWPKPTYGPGTYRTVRDAWVQIPRGVHTVDLPVKRTSFAGKVFPGPFRTKELHLTRDWSPLSMRRFRAIPAGGSRFDLPDELLAPCWRSHTTGAGDVMGRLRWDEPGVTVRTEFFKPEKGRYIHPTEHRTITHHEAARLQDFPDEYLWVGTKAEIARQIGNAVPLPLGRALGASIALAAMV